MSILERRLSIENIRTFNKIQLNSDQENFTYYCQSAHRNEVIGMFFRLGYKVIEFDRPGRVHNVGMQVFRGKNER